MQPSTCQNDQEFICFFILFVYVSSHFELNIRINSPPNAKYCTRYLIQYNYLILCETCSNFFLLDSTKRLSQGDQSTQQMHSITTLFVQFFNSKKIKYVCISFDLLLLDILTLASSSHRQAIRLTAHTIASRQL